MYGQMTAGSWIYIGSAGHPAGDVRDLRRRGAAGLRRRPLRPARRHRGSRRDGRRAAARRDDERRDGARRRGRRGADREAPRDPLPRRARRRARPRDRPRPRRARPARSEPCRSASRPTPSTSWSGCSRAASFPDLVTDQTSAHDELDGYVPARRARTRSSRGLRAARSRALHRARLRDDGRPRPRAARAEAPRRGRLRLRQQPARPGEEGRRRRRVRRSAGSSRSTSGRSSARGRGRSAGPRSPGIPRTSATTDRALLELFPENAALARWLTLAGERVAFQGLPARICWLGYGERARAGLLFNDLVRTGQGPRARSSSAAITWTPGSVASPNRETEGMRDGSDAIADWPILNALHQHGVRRDLGLGPPRRRRRDRLLDPRRHGGRRGRDRGGAERRLAPRADGGPGNRRDAARRRRLSRRRSRPRGSGEWTCRSSGDPPPPRPARGGARRGAASPLLAAAGSRFRRPAATERERRRPRSSAPSRSAVADLARRAADFQSQRDVVRSLEGGGIAVNRLALFTAAGHALAGAPSRRGPRAHGPVREHSRVVGGRAAARGLAFSSRRARRPMVGDAGRRRAAKAGRGRRVLRPRLLLALVSGRRAGLRPRARGLGASRSLAPRGRRGDPAPDRLVRRRARSRRGARPPASTPGRANAAFGLCS